MNWVPIEESISRLTSLAVQVEKIEETSTAALGDVVGDTSRARAVETITLNDDLSSRCGDGQRGEESDEGGGELHLERLFCEETVNLIVPEACDGDDEREYSDGRWTQGFYLCFGWSAHRRASPTSVCFVLQKQHCHRLDSRMSGVFFCGCLEDIDSHSFGY
jgi:hypothetical protein